jgi:trk system potassium uptake protein TrkA
VYIVILGAGTVGYRMSSWFTTAGVEVTVVEKDLIRSQRIQDDFGSVVVQGDGTDVNVLDKAGVGRADLFLATLGRDEHNLVACQIAKHKFLVNKTVALVNEPDNNDFFSTLGVDITVNVTDLIVGDIETKTAAFLVEEI